MIGNLQPRAASFGMLDAAQDERFFAAACQKVGFANSLPSNGRREKLGLEVDIKRNIFESYILRMLSCSLGLKASPRSLLTRLHQLWLPIYALRFNGFTTFVVEVSRKRIHICHLHPKVRGSE